MSTLFLLCQMALRRRSVLSRVISLSAVLFALSPWPHAHATSVNAGLTLDEAIRLAEQAAPALSAREAALRAAELRVGPAGERPDPELVIGIDNLPVGGSDAWDWNRDDMTMRKVGLMQALPRREKLALRRQRAEADAEKERALLASARLGTREAVASAWIAAANAERRLALVLTLQPQAKALVDAATAAISAGRGSTADAVAAQQARFALDDRIATLRLARDQARMALAQWLPHDAARPLEPAPDWRSIALNPSANPPRVALHRDLRAYDAMTQAARTEIALARAEKRPDWSVELAYADRGPNLPSMLSLQFRVGLPLFAGRRQNPLIAANEAALLQLESERDAAVREHRTLLLQQEATWRSALDRADRYEQQLLPLADERVAAALAAYRGGSSVLQDVLNAFDAAIGQRIAYVDVLDALGEVWAALHFAYAEEA